MIIIINNVYIYKSWKHNKLSIPSDIVPNQTTYYYFVLITNSLYPLKTLKIKKVIVDRVHPKIVAVAENSKNNKFAIFVIVEKHETIILYSQK